MITQLISQDDLNNAELLFDTLGKLSALGYDFHLFTLKHSRNKQVREFAVQFRQEIQVLLTCLLERPSHITINHYHSGSVSQNVHGDANTMSGRDCVQNQEYNLSKVADNPEQWRHLSRYLNNEI